MLLAQHEHTLWPLSDETEKNASITVMLGGGNNIWVASRLPAVGTPI